MRATPWVMSAGVFPLIIVLRGIDNDRRTRISCYVAPTNVLVCGFQ
jgi:hypothetical protein